MARTTIRGSMDSRTPLLIAAMLLAVAWYSFWYSIALERGWEPGWPLAKIVTLFAPVVVAAAALVFGDPGYGMAENARRHAAKTAREAARKKESDTDH